MNNKTLVILVLIVLLFANRDKIKLPSINIKPTIPTPTIPFPTIPTPTIPFPTPEPKPPTVVEPEPTPTPTPTPEPTPEPTPVVEPAKPTGHWENRRVRTGFRRYTTKRVWVNNG